MNFYRKGIAGILVSLLMVIECLAAVSPSHKSDILDGVTLVSMERRLPTQMVEGVQKLTVLAPMLSQDGHWEIGIADKIGSIAVESYRVRDELWRTVDPGAEIVDAAIAVAHEMRQQRKMSFREFEKGGFSVVANAGEQFWGIRPDSFEKLGGEHPLKKATARLATEIERRLRANQHALIDAGRTIEGDQVPPEDVEISALAGAPESWDGRRVRVRGVFWVVDDRGSIYPKGSERASMIHPGTPAIEIDTRGWRELQGESALEVTIVGVFFAAPKAFTHATGTLRRVTEVHIGE